MIPPRQGNKRKQGERSINCNIECKIINKKGSSRSDIQLGDTRIKLA